MDEAERNRAHEAQRAAQHRAWRKRSDRERLAWLEEAKRFAAEALAAKERRTRAAKEPGAPEKDEPRDGS